MEISSGGIEDTIIIGGLIGVQIVYAGSAVLMSYLMALGLNSLTIVIYTSLATFLVLLPFSIFFERSQINYSSQSIVIYELSWLILYQYKHKCIN